MARQERQSTYGYKEMKATGVRSSKGGSSMKGAENYKTVQKEGQKAYPSRYNGMLASESKIEEKYNRPNYKGSRYK